MSELKAPDPTRVTVGLKQRKNVEDGYGEHVEVFISITDDARNGEKVGEAIDRIYKLLENKVAEKVEEATGG